MLSPAKEGNIVGNTKCQYNGKDCVGLSFCEYGCLSCSVKIAYGCRIY